MIIETERLIIIPFSLDLIRAAETNDRAAYKRLGIIPNEEWPEKDLKEALPVFRDSITKNGITGYGSWILLDKKRSIIGSAGYFGEPQDGIVEIGFGVIQSQQNKGYCTEAVIALIRWGMVQKRIRSIIAHCDKDNEKSRNVLTKAGLVEKGRNDDIIEWEMKVQWE